MASTLRVDTLQNSSQSVSVNVSDIPKFLYRSQYHKLEGNAPGTDLSCSYTAESFVVADADYNCIILRDMSITINGSNSGANGLDTGTVTSGYWYYAYVIYDSIAQTVSGILSLSSTAPSLPNGYTYYARVGSVYSTSSTLFRSFLQEGSWVNYTISGSTYGTSYNIASSTTTTYASFSTISVIPTSASKSRFVIRSNTSTTMCLFYEGLSSSPAITSAAWSATLISTYNASQTYGIALSTSSGTGYIDILGYEDNL